MPVLEALEIPPKLGAIRWAQRRRKVLSNGVHPTPNGVRRVVRLGQTDGPRRQASQHGHMPLDEVGDVVTISADRQVDEDDAPLGMDANGQPVREVL
ncbi:MAG: hypothetical protein U0Q12_14510 [Vicinamibacterales bacterium]